ncbi:30S ribosomal protein S17 [Candidatus Peregrinibacteria bacterium]|nr:30S ribosomal protein S17 [Candidatus Peregrinibacteria bacterium]
MRTKTGIVTSNKMQKTLVVMVHRYVSHPKYKKRYAVSSKFYAHCKDSSSYAIGDKVTIRETRPLSKLKRWEVIKNA